MPTVTLPKTEYEQLKKQARAYKQFASRFFESAIKNPVGEVVEDFKKTNLYTREFLKDLEAGLRKSSYANKHENKAPQKRS